MPTSGQRIPYYLEKVFPKPDSTVKVTEWDSGFPVQRGVCVRLLGHRILEPGDDLSLREIDERTRLKLDGMFVEIIQTNDYLTEFTTASGARCSGPYDICGHLDLQPGEYEASFLVQKTSGEKLEYTWRFWVVE